MRIQVTAANPKALQQDLRAAAKRARKPRAEVFDRIAGRLESIMRRNIKLFGANLGSSGKWPKLKPLTFKIRAFYKHGKRPLIRRGDLIRSILGTQLGNEAEALAHEPFAGIVDQGGTPTTGTCKNRVVPARPFAAITEGDVDEIEDLVAQHITVPLRG